MSYGFISDGECYFTLQYNGDILDTAATLDDWLLNPRADYRRFCYFNQSANAGLVDGVRLTGQTSGAVIKVGRVVLTGGAIDSAGLGVLFFQPVSGKIVSGENLRVSTTTYCVAASGELDSPVGARARALFVQAESNDIRFAMGGATPTNSAATPANFGTIIKGIPENVMISGFKNVETFKMVHAVSTANAVVNLQIYY